MKSRPGNYICSHVWKSFLPVYQMGLLRELAFRICVGMSAGKKGVELGAYFSASYTCIYQ